MDWTIVGAVITGLVGGALWVMNQSPPWFRKLFRLPERSLDQVGEDVEALKISLEAHMQNDLKNFSSLEDKLDRVLWHLIEKGGEDDDKR